VGCPDIGVPCVDDEELLRVYESDASPLRGKAPWAAFFPSHAEEVAKVIKWANEKKVAVYPYGGGSSLVGSPLPAGGVVLDTSLLLSLEVHPEDKLVLAGAGWKLEELNAKLRAHGLWFPVDPGSVELATVGGVVASNAGGIRAVKYGLTSDRVRALEFVTPTGEVVWSGPWTRKSSTWLRLHQLIIGSEGTLGVVTKALLTLERLPAKREAAFLQFEDNADMVRAVNEILELSPSALEFMDPKTVGAVNSNPSAPLRLPEKYTLLVEFDDDNATRKIDYILSAYEGFKESFEKLWRYRKLAGPSLTLLRGSRSDWDVAVLLSSLPRVLEELYSKLEEWDVAIFGHIGDGNLHVNMLHPPEEQWVIKAIEVAREVICDVAKKYRATVSGEHGIGLLKLSMLGCEVDERSLELWRTLKKALDPNLILNPGKKIPL